MSFDNTHNHSFLDTIQGRFHGLMAALHSYRARTATYNRTWRELSAMSDRELLDLGLHRSDIPDISAKAAAQHI